MSKIFNKTDSNGDYIVEEFASGQPNKLIICVHGFGVDRGDGGGMFFDIAKDQQNAVTVLIDLNSIDPESGMLKVNDFRSQTERLKRELDVFKLKHPKLKLILIGHSMGCALIAKNKILASGVIFLAPASGNIESKLRPRLLEREGSFEDAKNRQLIAKRSDGSTTIVPHSFFEELKDESWPARYEQYLKIQNPLNLIVAGQDEIIKESTKDILKLSFSSIEVIEDADHNFLRSSRVQMLASIKALLVS